MTGTLRRCVFDNWKRIKTTDQDSIPVGHITRYFHVLSAPRVGHAGRLPPAPPHSSCPGLISGA